MGSPAAERLSQWPTATESPPSNRPAGGRGSFRRYQPV